jgi:transposase
VGGLGFGDGQGAKGGDLTGPNPTDRAKLGVKRHLLTDGRGVPLAAVLSPANVHDKWTLAEVLDSVVLRAPRGPRRPEHLCLDKGYFFRDCAAIVRTRHVVPHIRRKGEPPLLGRVRGRARRWVVERTGSWCNRFRALLVRWDKKTANYLGSLHLACAYLTFARAGLLGWALSSTSPLFWTYSACRPGLSCAGGGGRAFREQCDGKAAGS